MQRLKLCNVREKCHWLAVCGSLLVLTATISLTLLWREEGQALARTSQGSLLSLPGNYTSPHGCRECHTDEFRAWSNTTHAQASFDPVFQVSLQRVAEPGECFSCHTTGYNSTTGQFVLSGVTCEACHGPYRPEHPQESMAVAVSEELCGTCHTNTFAEWTTSHHSQVGVSCADCHEVHTQKTYAADNTSAPCANCHKDQIQDATHLTHRYGEIGVQCIDCHLARADANAEDMVKGQIATGHSFAVVVGTCSDCHPAPLN